jgi:ABC-type glycerol-3-phosphate transport system substrate-binding protein
MSAIRRLRKDRVMLHLPFRCLVSVGLLALSVGACAPSTATPAAVQLASPPPIAATPTLEPTPLPTPEETPTVIEDVDPLAISLWWPDTLAPIDNPAATALLDNLLARFQNDAPELAVEFRLKKVDAVGGILSTLRTANTVAPGALPDLTLMRREDMQIAAEAGLIQPITPVLAPVLTEDIPPAVLELGMVRDQLYGLPYLVQVQHVLYTSNEPPVDAWTFEALLDAQIPFYLPANRANGLNDTLLLQYLTAGGGWQDDQIILDENALGQVFDFYEQAQRNNMIDPVVVTALTAQDYLNQLTDETPQVAVVSSSTYLRLLDSGSRYGFGPIPTVNGEPATLIDGWMWVMVTSDPDEQAQALRLLDYMVDVDQEGQFARALYLLPARRAAMRAVEPQAYTAFINSLYENATPVLTTSETGALARAIQNGFIALLNGQTTAETATHDVMVQQPSS